MAPYERRVIELLRNSKDKRARKLAKKRVRFPPPPPNQTSLPCFPAGMTGFLLIQGVFPSCLCPSRGVLRGVVLMVRGSKGDADLVCVCSNSSGHSVVPRRRWMNCRESLPSREGLLIKKNICFDSEKWRMGGSCLRSREGRGCVKEREIRRWILLLPGCFQRDMLVLPYPESGFKSRR